MKMGIKEVRGRGEGGERKGKWSSGGNPKEQLSISKVAQVTTQALKLWPVPFDVLMKQLVDHSKYA
jgi:hypothetical protein